MCKKGLYLHFEFHPFTPQKFVPVLLNSSRPLSILGVAMIVLLMMLMLTVCVVLLAHERISFLFLVTLIARVQHERRQNHPSIE
jgi:type IV secretory pathway VirB3-like protein